MMPSAQNDSFSEENLGLLDCPHYTRPAQFEDMNVPTGILQGNHQPYTSGVESKHLDKRGYIEKIYSKNWF